MCVSQWCHHRDEVISDIYPANHAQAHHYHTLPLPLSLPPLLSSLPLSRARSLPALLKCFNVLIIIRHCAVKWERSGRWWGRFGGGCNDQLTSDLWPLRLPHLAVFPPSVLSGWPLILGVHQGPIKGCLTLRHLTWLCLVNMLQHVCEGQRDREFVFIFTSPSRKPVSPPPIPLSPPFLCRSHLFFASFFSLSVFRCGSASLVLSLPPSLSPRLSLEMLIPGPGRLDETELSFSH